MSLLGFLDHLWNFMLPAALVGLLVAACAPLVMKKAGTHHNWLRQGAINFVACMAALLGGLLIFGHDGKMATYAVMVMACGTSQWVAAKAWRA